jgi:hypothetical protein
MGRADRAPYPTARIARTVRESAVTGSAARAVGTVPCASPAPRAPPHAARAGSHAPGARTGTCAPLATRVRAARAYPVVP